MWPQDFLSDYYDYFPMAGDDWSSCDVIWNILDLCYLTLILFLIIEHLYWIRTTENIIKIQKIALVTPNFKAFF